MNRCPELGNLYDVAVIGAGPAGSTAARVAAEGGARVLLVDKYSFPRDKLCGGGLTPRSLQLVPDQVLETIEGRADSAMLTYRGRLKKRRRSSNEFVALVRRTRFDKALVDAAIASGVTFVGSVTLRGVQEVEEAVVLSFGGHPAREVRARIVIGADGVNGRCRQYVGVTEETVDLALEAELARDTDDHKWENAVWIDWGRLRGAYAWLFPKGDRLTVGVIAEKGKAQEARAYLTHWISQLGLEQHEVISLSGHLTRVRRHDSPLRRGHVLVAGDAAGLLEPCSREGISFALRSGILAGHVAARATASGTNFRRDEILEDYCREVTKTMALEQERGRLLRRMFERAPLFVHLAVGWSPSWSAHAVQRMRGVQRSLRRASRSTHNRHRKS